MVGALQDRADRLVEELTRRHHGQLILPTLLRLANVDVQGVPVRRRIPRTAFTAEEQIIIDAFVDACLLTTHGQPTGEPGGAATATVEVAHEALLRQWSPLRQAIEGSRDALRLRAELGREAADWQAGGGDALLSAARHAAGGLRALERAYISEENSLELRFLQASRAAARRDHRRRADGRRGGRRRSPRRDLRASSRCGSETRPTTRPGWP